MFTIELYNMIEDGESSTLEFKRKFNSPEKIAKEMIAFANSKGGKIIFGVDDDKTIVGVESEKEELELIDTAAKFYCHPEINYTYDIVGIKNKDVIVVTIPESTTKPHKLIKDNVTDNIDTKVYIRHNDQSLLASKETVKVLKAANYNSPVKITLGNNEKALLDFLNENQRITMKGFKKLVNISERRASRTLITLIRANVLRHHYFGKEDFYTLV
jgi:predicted HTH transcriptional regulator